MTPPALQSFYDDNRPLRFTAQRLSLVSTRDVINRSGLPFLPLALPFDVPHAAMLTEARALRHLFVNHRSDGEDHQGWSSLCLHGLSSTQTRCHTEYGYSDPAEAPYGWTEIADLCPVTTAFFRDLFGYDRYARVRFMGLEPGGYILPHRDSDTDRLNAINIALNNPDGCDFVMEGKGLVPFRPGTANMLALVNRHIVWNRSSEDRIHIIVHGRRAPGSHWRHTLLRSYRAFVQ